MNTQELTEKEKKWEEKKRNIWTVAGIGAALWIIGYILMIVSVLLGLALTMVGVIMCAGAMLFCVTDY